MRIITIIFCILLFTGITFISYAENEGSNSKHMVQHNKMHSMPDTRISLDLSPEVKQHLLINMRSNVETIQSIIGLMSEGSFDKASQIAHSKIGLNEEMQKMCNAFENEAFKELGLAFHKSGDDLGDALKTKDMT